MTIQTEDRREITEAQEREHRELAEKIMVFARDQIMVSLRFLDRALFRMPMIPTDTVFSYGVNGREIFFNTDYVLCSFREEPNRCTRAFLHMILHYVFSHPFQYEKLDRVCWDLACDIAVEKTILDLGLADVRLADDDALRRTVKKLESYVPVLTAEKIYRFLLDNPEAIGVFEESAGMFERDDHLHWIPKRETDAGERTGDTYTTDTRTAMIGCHEADTGEEGDQAEDIDEALVGQTRDEWADVSQHAKTDLETFSKE
ncbi:MAG: hypothetical protein LUD53_07070 [Clostridiales bacterium]|nr:hypothetical protein [Clostridiales bacterium]